MTWGFIRRRYALDYVHGHVDERTPLVYRVSGLWSGDQGTLLLWTTIAALAIAANAWLWQRRVDRGMDAPPDGRSILPWTLLWGNLIVTALGLVAWAVRPFARTSAAALAAEPTGRGLLPVLETPYMVIHPPLQFIAYALVVVPFSAALAYASTGRRDWSDVALPWTRWAFLFSWVGLVLGAMWAYYVLNFGGFWAWDPVETANLITFIPLIPLVHALVYHRKRGMYKVMAPTFACLAFFATLFATLATRTGWWVSVHAFTDPAQSFNRDALGRLLEILDRGGVAEHLARLMFAAAALSAITFSRRSRDALENAGWSFPAQRVLFLGTASAAGAWGAWAVVHPAGALSLWFEAGSLVWPSNPAWGVGVVALAALALFSWPLMVELDSTPGRRESFVDRWINMRQLVWVGMVLVSLSYLIIVLIALASVNGYVRQAYDSRAALVVVPFLGVIGVAMSNAFIGQRRSLHFAAAALALGLALVAMGLRPWQVWLAAPLGMFALWACSLKLLRVSNNPGDGPMALRVAGGSLLFGGILGSIQWANPPSRIDWFVTVVHPQPYWAVVGLVASATAILAAPAVLRRRHLKMAWVGAGSLVVAAPPALALLLGPIVAGALVRNQGAFAGGIRSWNLGSLRRDLMRQFRKTGIYVIHVGLVLGLAGYALSTHYAGEPARVVVSGDLDGTAHGYSFHFMGGAAEGLDPETGSAARLTTDIQIAKSGQIMDVASLRMVQALPLQYGEKVSVERFALHDVYLHPVAFEVQTGGRQMMVGAQETNRYVAEGAEVTGVTFDVRLVPAMHLVWGGAWLIAFGMVVALGFGNARLDRTRFAHTHTDGVA